MTGFIPEMLWFYMPNTVPSEKIDDRSSLDTDASEFPINTPIGAKSKHGVERSRMGRVGS